MTRGIDNSQDMLDVRDVIARIEELEGEREALADDLKEAQESLESFDPEDGGGDEAELEQNVYHAQEALKEWDASEEATELKTLSAFLEEMKGYGEDEQWRGDWYPVTLIRDSYFEDYAQEMVEELYSTDTKGFPSFIEIDWEATARNVRMDYSSVEYDGVTYWYR